MLVALAVPAAALAQESANSLFLGTVTIDGQPAPNLRTVITVTGNGLECGHGLTEAGTFSMILTCPAGVAVVSVNGVIVDRIDVAPGGTVVRRISLTSGSTPAPTAPPLGTPAPATPPPAGTPRPPSTGNASTRAGAPAETLAVVLGAALALAGVGVAAAQKRR